MVNEMKISQLFMSVSPFLLLALVILVGCASEPGNDLDQFQCFSEPIIETESDLGMPYGYIDIQVSLVEQEDKYTPNDMIPLYIENTSSHSIWLPKDKNVVIWEIVDENSWSKIGNSMGYDLAESIILGPKGSPNAKNLIFIHPVISVREKPKEILVTLWGYRYEAEKYCEDRHAGRITIIINPSE